MRWAQGKEEGDAVILPGRKMKDDVRLIFSLIRQQTEMEGGEQSWGRGQVILEQPTGTKERGHGGRKLRLPVLWGRGL